ncbi:hypothetical protein KAU92_00945 [Candidatus Bathyarchaeota archaeon]|nr:hypothetical protein [Candidatus Bathyarchaeota archaeon]
MKETLIIIVVIALLSGILHTIKYSSPLHYFGTATIAMLYALGFAGLITMYQSAKCKDNQKRWLMLLIGFLTIL